MACSRKRQRGRVFQIIHVSDCAQRVHILSARPQRDCRIENVPEIDDEAVDTSVRDAKIWKAIDELHDRCREVFLLSKRDGLSNEEIAEELNISVKTVKNQMTKAFARLRDDLSPKHKPFFLPFLFLA